MGLPSQLDGKAKGLKVKENHACDNPDCRKVFEHYRVKKEGNKILLMCPACKKVLDEKECDEG